MSFFVAARQHIASVRIYHAEGISQIPSGIYIVEKETDFKRNPSHFLAPPTGIEPMTNP